MCGMKSFAFRVDFGIGPKISRTAHFNLVLNDDEIAYIQDYLHLNGDDCGYEYMEFDNRPLFERINDAANQAVLNAINKGRKKKLDFFDIPWETISFDFIWADEFLKRE